MFSTNARRTPGRPSGGLACYIRRSLSDSVILDGDLSPVCYRSSEHFLAVRLGDSVLVNAYLLHDKKSVQSFKSFAMS